MADESLPARRPARQQSLALRLVRDIQKNLRRLPPAWQEFHQALLDTIIVNVGAASAREEGPTPLVMLDHLASMVRHFRVPDMVFFRDVLDLPGADSKLLVNLRNRAMAEPIPGSVAEELLSARVVRTAEPSPAKPALRRRRTPVPRQVEDVPGHDLKPDPLTAQTPAELVDRMRRYRIWAGDLALRELVRRGNGAFALSTLSKTLKENKLPPLELLTAFIRACGGSDDDVRRWTTAWRQLRMPEPCAEPGQALSTVTPLPRARSAG